MPQLSDRPDDGPTGGTTALLLVTPGCPHCPAILDALGELLKQGVLARLEAVNVATDPQTATRLGVRSVPWFRIGPYEFDGAHTAAEIRRWVEHASAGTGAPEYLRDLLAAGRRTRALAWLRAQPDRLGAVLQLLADPDTDLPARLGADSLIVEFAGEPALVSLVPQLDRLAQQAPPALRADACHYLGLSGDRAARPALERALHDDDAHVREIAMEALTALEPAKA